MTQPLAISLRPRTFDEVIGQESVVKALRAKIDSPPTAILFSGPSGTGKTTLAGIVARAIQDGSSDEEMWDIQHKNAAKENGVAFARQWEDDAKYPPIYGRYRVIILEEAHMMTPEAQNTLLIPVEKEGSSTVWIFCTTEPEKIIPALRSRCAVYELRPLTEKNIGALIIRAVKAGAQTKDLPDGYAKLFLDEVLKIGLTNTRDILYSYEKYISGVPLAEALIPPPDQNPLYTDIAKYAVKGDWERARGLLLQSKPSDMKGLRSVVSGFLRNNLLNNRDPEAAAEALIRLGNLNAFEDGISFSALVAIIYTYSRKVKK